MYLYMCIRHATISIDFFLSHEVPPAEGTLQLIYVLFQRHYVQRYVWRAREKKSGSHGRGVNEDALVCTWIKEVLTC